MVRGWTITDGSRTIDSLEIEKTGIICIGEDNIDDVAFSNEYVYNEDTQSYTLNVSYPNQVVFGLRFAITRFGTEAMNTIIDLRSFFDQSGKEFTIIRNVTGFPNTFVVDRIVTGHLNDTGNFLEFEVSGSYVGNFQNYEARRQRITFNGHEPVFHFTHTFDAPEPSTILSDLVLGYMIKELPNNSGRITGLIYTFEVIDRFNQFIIENLTFNEKMVVNYQFEEGDVIIIDTESEEPSFTLNRAGVITNLIRMVDFSVSSIPILYQGVNRIRIDLFQDGVGVERTEIYAEYWDRVVSASDA